MGDEMRFSDEELRKLKKDLTDHMQDEHDWRKEHDEWRQSHDARLEKMLEAQERNTEQLSQVIYETRDIVQIHKDFQSVARVGTKVQDLLVWCAKAGGVLAAIGAGVHYILGKH